MTSSRTRIIANLESKENPTPVQIGKKLNESVVPQRSLTEALPFSQVDGNSKRRTVVDTYDPDRLKPVPLYGAKTKKQVSINSFWSDKTQKHKKNLKKLSTKCDKAVQVDTVTKSKKDDEKTAEEEGIALLCDDKVPERYWELLAEERRKGLLYALKENKALAEQTIAKDNIIKELQEEIVDLKKTVKEAENLASILKGIMGEDFYLDDEEISAESDSCNEETQFESGGNDDSYVNNRKCDNLLTNAPSLVDAKQLESDVSYKDEANHPATDELGEIKDDASHHVTDQGSHQVTDVKAKNGADHKVTDEFNKDRAIHPVTDDIGTDKATLPVKNALIPEESSPLSIDSTPENEADHLAECNLKDSDPSQ